MTDSELTESAKRIADAVMRGDYGSIVTDDDLGGADEDQYAGWGDKFKGMNKKHVMVISGTVLGVLLIAGVAAGGYYYWKKRHTSS